MVGRRHGAAVLALVAALAGAGSAAAAGPVLVIDGAGDGHGVGMSQTGADGLALHGYSTRAILKHYYTGTTVGRLATTHIVTVLLQSGLRSVVFSGATRAGTRAVRPAATYIATTAPNGELALESAHGRLLSYLPAPLHVSGPGPITFDGAASSGVVNGRYRGSLNIVLDGSRLDVINRVGLESYLRGVVASESPSSWPAAELEAQAIAARSYAVASAPAGSFDLYADTRSQEYGGYNAEAPSGDAAVAATAGEVVTYAGKPVVTYYFASSGGATENVANVFPGVAPEPYLRGVIDPYDASHFGPFTISVHSADARLRGLVNGTLESIVVTRRGVSPRVVSADLIGSGGTTTVSGLQLERALGLQSSWACFTVSSSSATVAAGWDRACGRPVKLRNVPSGASGETGTTVGGGAVAPTGPGGPTGRSGASGATGTAGASGQTAASGSSAGGAVGPSG
jgi:stage II sporulation protein D